MLLKPFSIADLCLIFLTKKNTKTEIKQFLIKKKVKIKTHKSEMLIFITK